MIKKYRNEVFNFNFFERKYNLLFFSKKNKKSEIIPKKIHKILKHTYFLNKNYESSISDFMNYFLKNLKSFKLKKLKKE